MHGIPSQVSNIQKLGKMPVATSGMALHMSFAWVKPHLQTDRLS